MSKKLAVLVEPDCGDPAPEPDARSELAALRQCIHDALIGMIRFEADGRVTLMNPVAAQFLGPMARRDRPNAYDLLAPIVPDLAAEIAAFAAEFGIVVKRRRVDLTEADGSLLALSLTVQRIGRTSYMALIKDITHLVSQERQLFRDAQRFRAIIHGIREYAIYIMDRDGRVTEWNRSIERIAGWRPGDVEGRHIGNFFLSDNAAPVGVDRLLEIARREGSAEAEGWRRRRDGSQFWASTAFTALRDDQGEVWGFVGISRDLTDRKRMEDELRSLAITDPLTGAHNRRYGQARLTDEWRRHERYCIPLSVLMIDIDRFKSINDRFGHEAGDVALRDLVTVCTSILRANDVLVRWGGEEFLAILPDTAQDAARDAAERVSAALVALRIRLDDGTMLGFTVSVGVAEARDASIACLVRRADAALYAAKKAGRNRIIVAGPEPHGAPHQDAVGAAAASISSRRSLPAMEAP